MTHGRHRLATAAALAAAAALLTGCQSDGDSGDGGTAALSLSGLTETAEGVPEDGADACPLPYDMGVAAKAAGIEGEVGPGSVRPDEDTPVATGEGGKRAKSNEPLGQNPGALVSCTFHIGQDDVQVHTIATSKPSAVLILAPVALSLTWSGTDDVIPYVEKVAASETGEVVVADSGNIAAVRLELDGEGDAALLVGAGEDGDTSLGREQVGALTEALAGQVQ
ncbi:hypothetical protein [Streptomyces broussonetiae]|uniref:DUF3558 domain-containing protein n=1 Tax=Streptomyces broussonetiae TaxID=2686304 RepID=A0ABV5EKZ6_9ACTN